MTIALDLAAQILRLHSVEKWRVGTIARQLHVHRDVVRRVLAGNSAPVHPSPLRPSRIDPYRPFILATLSKFPTLTAARLQAMVSERGYRGAGSHFRHLIASLRPRPPAEAYLRLRTLPGEQMQCDWGHFGHLQIGRARRPLMAFVMVLSSSRQIFLRFFLNARIDSFLRGHVEAFAAFNGSSRVVLYDNLKSAVLERQGDTIRFNPELLALASHYRFEPRPVAVARGNEKGRVERAIRYVRDTNIVIYVIKNKPLSALQLFNEHAGHTAISAITLAELLHGAEKSNAPARSLGVVEDFCTRLDVLSYGPKAAQHYGSIRSALER